MIEIKYFVHGTTTDNLDKKATGWLPGELSEKGKEQAKVLGETVANEYFDIVFCSDLTRAIESSKIVFGGRQIEIIQDARLREGNYGDYNGKDNSLVDYETHIEERFPNGECLLDVEERIKSFVSFLKENYDNKKIAIMAHRAPQLALDVLTKNMTWQEALANDWRKTKNWQPGWVYILK